MKRLVERWTVLVRERFKPTVYVPMILLFTGANGIYLVTAESQQWNWGRFGAVFVLLLSFFLRMRVFDEIKDYETDLVINPHRPLARGVASFRQVKRGLFVFSVLELVLAWNLGFFPFLTHIVAMYYSVMMFEEFFLGDHLRPHLTTYAISHTFVSVLLGASAAVAMTRMDLRNMHFYHIFFFMMNWAFFNVFEFARKTFAPGEEREKVESYSKIFGPVGAVALCLSQGALGNYLLYRALENPILNNFYPRMAWSIGIFAVYVLTCLPYAIKPNHDTAKLFRATSSFYLLAHYICVVALFAWR